MKNLSVATAFIASITAGFVTIAAAMPPPVPAAATSDVVPIDGCRSGASRIEVDKDGKLHRVHDNCVTVIIDNGGGGRQRDFDCHRDVRTHRVDGVQIRHRHVGADCALREVRTSTSALPN